MSTGAGCCRHWRIHTSLQIFTADAIPHRPVAALPLVPHPQQRRVAGVNKVDDPHVGLAGAIIQSILAGQQPRCMSLLWFQRNPLPTDWVAQREVVTRFDA